ncbi:CBS domain-containing protein [Halorussus salilacus]|uniref:CBS domain-containing protein n=1 Tax=Halorussus salilacus TaxID=2953750 RepID=UPI0020A038FA|nr:CBS domain-containing protein [Halorussus salilacus]USZ68148.1 CBS domain-containing protein [Halorussus salilacus]
MEGEVTVRDVMSREYVGVSESDTVLGAVRLMDDDGVGSVVVLRGSEPVGIMTESDVLALVADEGDPTETPVSEVMSEPVISVEADRGLSDAAGTMSHEDIRRVLVTDGDELVGVLDERDVISASASLSGMTSLRENPSGVGGEPVGNALVDDRREPEMTGSVVDDGDRAEYSDRSICEACGTLSRELSNVNGQLICVDCRDV